jgi:hypothetical protein
MAALSLVYDASFVGAMLFLCAGLALPPVARRAIQRRHTRTEADLLRNLTDTWARATATRKEARLAAPAEVTERGEAASWRLHRMLVEIHDALLMDPMAARFLDETDVRTLTRTEEYLAANQAVQDRRTELERRERRTGLRDK